MGVTRLSLMGGIAGLLSAVASPPLVAQDFPPPRPPVSLPSVPPSRAPMLEEAISRRAVFIPHENPSQSFEVEVVSPTPLDRLVTPAAAQVARPLDRQLEPAPLPASLAPTTPSAIVTLAGEIHDPALGFSGPSGVAPRSGNNEEFETVEDRWRIGFPEWDRYGTGQKKVFDRPYMLGRWFDPYNQHVLKGDYPIYGQHTFLNITGFRSTVFEGREIPTATTPFESTARAFEEDFFGRPGQFLFSDLTTVSFDLFHGDAAFKPIDWRIRATPAFNVNTLSAQELAVINPDVRRGTVRNRTWGTLQEWFLEYKLADLSEEYDFVSARVGSQPFTSDFRGFIFSDINRGARIFGTLDGNRTQYNLAYFRQQEKDTNSGLNTFEDRNQNIVIANLIRQDFIFPGFNILANVHYNNDGPDTLFDKNHFLVRPDPVGVFQPHRVEVAYLGINGEGHIGRYNISSAFYWAVGRDSRNPLAGTPQAISAQMAALEVSYDRDWARFRMSGFYQSGDGDVNNGKATGFDSILDNTNFAGEFSFFNRQNIPLFGVQLTQRNSLYSDLRSSKIQGQSNFVNPGLWLVNTGMDVEVTPRLRSINNVNFLWFDKTNPLEVFTFQGEIDRDLGTDLSTALEWRPRLNNQIIILAGASTLLPASGFRQLYNKIDTKVKPLSSVFVEAIFAF